MPPPVDPATPSVVPSPVSFFGDSWHSTLAMLLKLRRNISQALPGAPPGCDSPRKIPLAPCIPPRIGGPKSLSRTVSAMSEETAASAAVIVAASIASSPAHGQHACVQSSDSRHRTTTSGPVSSDQGAGWPTESRWERCYRARCEREHSSAQRYAPPLACGSPPMTAGVQAPSLRG